MNLSDYIDQAKTMLEETGNRKQIFQEMDAMFTLEAGGMPQAAWIKPTVCPDPRNAVIGGARMLSASAPKWKIASASVEEQGTSDALENLCQVAWSGAGRISRKPVHFDVNLSALLYGEVHLRWRLVSDMIAAAPKQSKRLERVAWKTPVIFEAINPKLCHVLKDATGLTAHLTQREMMVSEINRLSKEAEAQLAGRRETEQVTINELFNDDGHAVWIDGQSEALLLAETDSGIPVAYADMEGSNLFSLDTDVDACQPFLYGVYKSKLWERQNLSYTVFYSLFYALGSSPVFIAQVNDPSREIAIDTDVPGKVIKVGQGESIQQLAKSIFTSDFMQAVTLADQKMVESTMYRTAVGESPGTGAPYSLAALLSANGRQALIPYERMSSHAIGMAMEGALLSLKSAGQPIAWREAGEEKSFDPEEIPDDIEVTANLRIELPVDERQNVQVATALTQGEKQLTTVAYAREKFLDIGQSADMDKAIFKERFDYAQAQTLLQMKIAEMQAAAQAKLKAMQQPAQPGPGQPPPPQAGPQLPPGPPPEMPPGEIPPELMQQLAQQPGAAPGLPMTGPIEPGMQGTQLPPEAGLMPGGA
jgi:hypothetical protein